MRNKFLPLVSVVCFLSLTGCERSYGTADYQGLDKEPPPVEYSSNAPTQLPDTPATAKNNSDSPSERCKGLVGGAMVTYGSKVNNEANRILNYCSVSGLTNAEIKSYLENRAEQLLTAPNGDMNDLLVVTYVGKNF